MFPKNKLWHRVLHWYEAQREHRTQMKNMTHSKNPYLVLLNNTFTFYFTNTEQPQQTWHRLNCSKWLLFLCLTSLLVPTKVLMHPVCAGFTLALPGSDLIQGEWCGHHQCVRWRGRRVSSINILWIPGRSRLRVQPDRLGPGLGGREDWCEWLYPGLFLAEQMALRFHREGTNN